MVRTGFSFLKLRIDECHSSILRSRGLFSRSLSELSALINSSETSWVEEFCSSKAYTYKNIGMLRMQEFFWVGGLIKTF